MTLGYSAVMDATWQIEWLLLLDRACPTLQTESSVPDPHQRQMFRCRLVRPVATLLMLLLLSRLAIQVHD
jgi:hypothetical protein